MLVEHNYFIKSKIRIECDKWSKSTDLVGWEMIKTTPHLFWVILKPFKIDARKKMACIDFPILHKWCHSRWIKIKLPSKPLKFICNEHHKTLHKYVKWDYELVGITVIQKMKNNIYLSSVMINTTYDKTVTLNHKFN